MTRAWALDAGERVARAFVLSFAGQMVLAGAHVFSLSALHAAATSGVVAVFSALLSVLGTQVSGSVSPASLVKAKPEPDAAGSPPPMADHDRFWSVTLPTTGGTVYPSSPAVFTGQFSFTATPPPDEPPPAAVPAKPKPRRPSGGHHAS